MTEHHQNDPLELRTGTGDPDWTLVLAHGRGSNPSSFTDFAKRLDLNARVLLLEADNNTWYPNGFMAEFDKNEPWLTAALDYYERTVAEVLEDTDPRRVIAGGFSQGACLTSEWLARNPRKLGGVLILTGGLIGPEGTRWDRADLGGMKAYLASSLIDEWIPVERAWETAHWLAESGADLTYRLFNDREHTISDAEVRQIRELFSD